MYLDRSGIFPSQIHVILNPEITGLWFLFIQFVFENWHLTKFIFVLSRQNLQHLYIRNISWPSIHFIVDIWRLLVSFHSIGLFLKKHLRVTKLIFIRVKLCSLQLLRLVLPVHRCHIESSKWWCLAVSMLWFQWPSARSWNRSKYFSLCLDPISLGAVLCSYRNARPNLPWQEKINLFRDCLFNSQYFWSAIVEALLLASFDLINKPRKIFM